ncbi:MAG: exodeoxyribonuclease VII large subunit [Eubacterium sp.]|nr:exodeoxyribonuclease VII large subunit [Eubacterium sp.]
MNKPLTVTVSQVNRRISLMIKSDKTLSDICVKGEILNFVRHYKSGHIYFTLKDEESSLKCVMFSENTESLRFIPEDGITVKVRGRLDVYERDGRYQLYAVEIEKDGTGSLYLEFERLKSKLSEEGLFSQKREIPKSPKRIALVTAKGGAALQDIISVIERRFPMTELMLIPVAVQGETAPNSIVSGLEAAQHTGSDLIIFGRGGGSSEDLSAFNSECVARAVYKSKIPTISAVGHEIDFTIADFVADLRAPTPSAAAELAVPDINGIKLDIKRIEEQLKYRIKAIYDRKKLEFAKTVEIIRSLSPEGIMLRGYSLVYKEGSLIKHADDLDKGDLIKIKMNGGEVNARIIRT